MEGLGSAKMALELFHTAREGAAALTSGTVGSRFVDNTRINQLAEGIGINTDEFKPSLEVFSGLPQISQLCLVKLEQRFKITEY